MRMTTALFPVCFSALLMGCVHGSEPKPLIQIQKVPLDIPDELLDCGWPPVLPEGAALNGNERTSAVHERVAPVLRDKPAD